MSEFVELRVGDHVGFLSGFPFSSGYFNNEKGVRLIRIRDLLGGDDNVIYFSGPFDPRWLVAEDDVLIGMDGDFNIVRWKNEPALLNQRILKVEGRPNSGITHAYFYHWCGPRLLEIHARTAATTVKHLSVRDLERAVGSFPSVEEQRRIATILTTLDEVIEATEKLVEKHQQIKAGLMHDLFTRGLWTRPELARGDHKGLPCEATAQEYQLRPPPEEAPGLYQGSKVGLIPKEWGVKPLADYTQHDITYGIVQAGPHVEGGIPYIRTGDMSGDELIREGMLCTSPLIAASYSRSQIRSGEIVCAIRATVGKVLPVPIDLDGANLTQGTARIAPNSRTHSGFLLWAMRSARVQREISLTIKGTTFMEITLSDLRKLPVGSPKSYDEQEAIAARLDACDTAISENRTHLAKLRQQKQGLMHDLLTGRVRVAEPWQDVIQQSL
jgi:type I restriction enzyme S subunit